VSIHCDLTMKNYFQDIIIHVNIKNYILCSPLWLHKLYRYSKSALVIRSFNCSIILCYRRHCQSGLMKKIHMQTIGHRHNFIHGYIGLRPIFFSVTFQFWYSNLIFLWLFLKHSNTYIITNTNTHKWQDEYTALRNIRHPQ